MKYKVYSINGKSYGDNEKTTDKEKFKDCPVKKIKYYHYTIE